MNRAFDVSKVTIGTEVVNNEGEIGTVVSTRLSGSYPVLVVYTDPVKGDRHETYNLQGSAGHNNEKIYLLTKTITKVLALISSPKGGQYSLVFDTKQDLDEWFELARRGNTLLVSTKVSYEE